MTPADRRWERPIPVVGDTTSAAERREDPSGWRFSEQIRAAFYEVVASRRDVRRFRPAPIEPEILTRVLSAAHQAPSVGLSQPWRFVVVTEAATREEAAAIAERERLRQASLLEPEAGRRMRDLQLDGIREAPVGIVVCCDRRAPAAGVLGRATFPDADLWSCACAIENLWLSARAEGLGLGWVTLFPPEELSRLVAAPEGVWTLGWLCLGYPDERPPEPGLERSAWGRRAPLSSVLVRERFGAIAPPPPRSRLRAPTQQAVVAARDDSDLLLTAPGSLGALDRVLDRLGALGLSERDRGVLLLAGADHPVTRHGVSTYGQTVSREVLEAAAAGESLGVAVARAAGLDYEVIDAGVLGPPVAGACELRPRQERGDLLSVDALTTADADALVRAASELQHLWQGRRLVALGEVGIGNTTVAAVLAALLLGLDPAQATGLGAGGDARTLERKQAVVQGACERIAARRLSDPLALLAAGGGPEIAVLTGVVLGVAAAGGAVVLDGLATGVAALLALRLEPAVAANLVAGQQSRERAHAAVLDALGVEPLLDLRLRAGEGVGASLATQLVLSAMRARALAGKVEPKSSPTV